MNDKNDLLDITRTSKKGTSLRITLPKRIAERLLIGEGDFLGFYEKDGTIYIKKIV
jgi:AbrB family looped-hinge helix DNA binding protein